MYLFKSFQVFGSLLQIQGVFCTWHSCFFQQIDSCPNVIRTRIVVFGFYIHHTFLYLNIFATGICWPSKRLSTDLCARGLGLSSFLSSIAIKDFTRLHQEAFLTLIELAVVMASMLPRACCSLTHREIQGRIVSQFSVSAKWGQNLALVQDFN